MTAVAAFAGEYAAALGQYLGGGGETALSRAYDLGRDALEGGMGVLDMAAMHQHALSAIMPDVDGSDMLANAAEFFAESLAPFEMTFRGYAEANERLQTLNSLLAKQNTELRRAKAAVESANDDLQSFSYTVSHDLQAPLRAMTGFAMILREDFPRELPDDARALVQRIIVAGDRMKQLIDDLLNLARFSRVPLIRRRVNMVQLVETAASELRHLSERTGSVEFRVGELPDAVVDASSLKQVFVNLLGNAFKFTRAKDVAIIEVGAKQDGNDTVYFVRDNGAGFDMKYARKLFNVFERLHSNAEFEGTGVGLSIVHRIIERHGGKVWAEGAIDQGATFYFTVPQSAREDA